MAQRIFLYLCRTQERTTVKLYAVVKERTLAHIVCCLPGGSEGLRLLP